VTVHGIGVVSVAGNVITVAIPAALKEAQQAGTDTQQRIRVRPPAVTLPLQSLPFRLQLHAVTASATGVTATGDATDIVLGSAT
jgi:hypothetical protein